MPENQSDQPTENPWDELRALLAQIEWSDTGELGSLPAEAQAVFEALREQHDRECVWTLDQTTLVWRTACKNFMALVHHGGTPYCDFCGKRIQEAHVRGEHGEQMDPGVTDGRED